MPREVVHIPAQQGPRSRTVAQQHKVRVAAYCRVSTEQDEQLNSFENQVTYYTEYINSTKEYELAGIYADEGISGTSTKHREQFNQMIADCEAGKIDMVITKSISRFARNTQDCLNYSRKLKDLGIGIRFEKEGIYTMDGTGELLFTILSSLAQDESRSISENTTWGIRSLYKQGVLHLNTNRFYGYDKDENGRLIINPEQAKVVRWVFESYMEGITPDVMARMLNENGVPGCMGEPKWTVDTILGILKNEKHMGDAILQKTYTADFMTKKQIKNTGQVEQYYVRDDHEPIVSKELWDIVQQELARRKQFMEKHGLRTMGRYTDRQPFTNRVYCGVCGDGFWRRRQARLDCVKYQWKCKNKCMGKQGVGCSNESVWEPDLHRAFVTAWNAMLERRAEFLPNWERQAQGNDQLAAFRAKQFMQLTEDVAPLKEVDLTLVGKVLEHCEVHPLGIMKFFFLDGTQIDICINE
jgi:DNA invertase Pin-like site-specific DNA recombinase